jgi:DMSO reductase anchor subunit
LDRPPGSPLAQTAFACTLALVALAASIFHLGRPWLAWRVFLGLRTSWLSREAVAFGIFAQLGVLYGLLAAAPLLPDFPGKRWAMTLTGGVQAAAAIMGMFGVFFSVMVYVATQRAHWSGTQTGVKFFGTTFLLGSASVLSVYVFTGGTLDRMSRNLLTSILVATTLKLAFEASVLLQYRNRRHTALKRVATLMLGDLSLATRWRFGCTILGGIVLPIILQNDAFMHSLPIACVLLLLLLVAGETLERYLFFRAAPASRMPGGIR